MRRSLTLAMAAGAAVVAAGPGLAGEGCDPRLTIARPGGPGGEFGRALAAIGDVDGDGWSDFAVGDPQDASGGANAGAVHVFSGRDGGLIRTIFGAPESATGTSVAACGDVNGDGVPDLLVGAPGWQPPSTNANTQPYKFHPVVRGMSEQRVDFVCVGGDSNHFYGTFGFDGGIQTALIQRVPMYATPVHSANENNGVVATRYGSFVFNSTGGPVGSMVTAPPYFRSQWDVSGAPTELSALHRFAYWGPGDRLAKEAAYGMLVIPNHPIDLSGNLMFHLTIGRFAEGDGVMTPQVRLSQPPYSPLISWPAIRTAAPGGVDEMTVIGNSFPASPGRAMGMQFRVASPESEDLAGPVFLSWLRLENEDRSTGFSFSTMWSVGGKTARDAAEFIRSVPLSSLTHYFEQVRRLQGPEKKVVLYFNEGGNDRLDWRWSVRGAGYSWRPEGFRDNMNAVRDRVLEVWNANGWPEEELYFLLMGYHVLSDDPSSGYEEDILIDLRRVCRELAADWPQATCIDMSAFMTEAEAIARGWYTDTVHAHLTTPGYSELGRRIVDSMFAHIARSGSAGVYSGADGSLLFQAQIPGDAGDEVGYSLAVGPDADGDGAPDFVVGAPARFNELLPGRAYLCSGVDGAVLRVLESTDGRDRLGESVALPGDLDGDFLADVVIGNTDDREIAPGLGSLSAWSSATGQRLWHTFGGQGIEQFGSTLISIGDADLDGRGDVVAGIPGRAKYGPGTGSARVFSGATGQALATLDGRAGGELMGSALAPVGDLDGDGRGDFAAGAPGADADGIDTGRISVVGGLALSPLAEFTGPGPGAAAGARLGPGAVTPDGRREILALSGGSVLVLDAAGLCCAADLTGDGVVDFADYLEFLNAYEAGESRVDFNRDGLIDFADYLDFLVRYDVGC